MPLHYFPPVPESCQSSLALATVWLSRQLMLCRVLFHLGSPVLVPNTTDLYYLSCLELRQLVLLLVVMLIMYSVPNHSQQNVSHLSECLSHAVLQAIYL